MLTKRDRQGILSIGDALTLDDRPLRGIFRDSHEPIVLDDSVTHARSIEARIAAADLLDARRGSVLVHEGSRYFVEETHPDGIGFVRLKLISQE